MANQSSMSGSGLQQCTSHLEQHTVDRILHVLAASRLGGWRRHGAWKQQAAVGGGSERWRRQACWCTVMITRICIDASMALSVRLRGLVARAGGERRSERGAGAHLLAIGSSWSIAAIQSTAAAGSCTACPLLVAGRL